MTDKLQHQDTDLAFATPIFRFRVPDCETLNAELAAEAYRLRAASDGIQRTNHGGWHSTNDFLQGELACIATLRQHIFDALGAIGRAGAPKMLEEGTKVGLMGWININPKGAYNEPHQHNGMLWSGCYYVQQPPVADSSSGLLEFLDPRPDLGNWRFMSSPWFQAKRKLRPEPGELVVFPSYAMHWVHPNETEQDRISIAWNANLIRS